MNILYKKERQRASWNVIQIDKIQVLLYNMAEKLFAYIS